MFNKKENKQYKNFKLVSVFMGLGHMRAAFPLKQFAKELHICGAKEHSEKKEYKIWKRIRKSYYFLSKASEIPLIGRVLKKFLLKIEEIPPYYPVKDNSASTFQTRYLNRLIKKYDLCKDLYKGLKQNKIPVINTFYASAHVLNQKKTDSLNYLLITDSDFNRVWVPDNPDSSEIKYLAPCSMVKQRLLTYGIKEKDIFLTGFPLPLENIGSEKNMEILKKNLFLRLQRLDPSGKFFSFHRESVKKWLNTDREPEIKERTVQILFAVGGAGAQVELADKILKSLKSGIKENKIKMVFSAGINRSVHKKIREYIKTNSMEEYTDRGVSIIFSKDYEEYFKKFNAVLNDTDILWTKPGELSFYSALGIPILLTPCIGPHETLNKWWLREIHASVSMPGPVEHSNEWISDFLTKGRFAEAAWDGFLKGRKLGTYKIRDLVLKNVYNPGTEPSDR